MKRYIAFLLVILALCGCSHNAPDPTTVTTTAATTTPTTESISTEPETIPTTQQTQPTEAPTVPVMAGFDPLKILEGMSLEEKVGQLFLTGCPGANAVSQLQKYHLGGYVLFNADTRSETYQSLQETIAAYQEASTIPMFIAVDEEGGTVCRVSSVSAIRKSRFPSPRDLYDQGGMELVLSTEEEKSLLLKDLGINVNLGPVCDITTKPSAFMYPRSLGQSPEITGEFAAKMCAVMAQNQVGSVLKHFPGYGNNTDTHTAVARDKRTLEELESRDLIPFAAAIESGCDAIMVSHTIVECLDPVYPASLSPTVHQYLRSKMVFGGVIITDDLVMQAVTDLYGAGEAAVLAVLAGNDMLCVSNYAVPYKAVLAAAEEGRIPMELLDLAVERILLWKYRLGLFDEEFSSDLT